jgi:RNA polymerase-binding transcription factor DksA
MIVRRAGKYVVISERSGRRFGTYDTLAEAEKRLRQIEFFKHLRARPTASRLDGAERHRLDEIDAAQARLAAGTFGACERCSTAIPLARLRAVPTARCCIACERVAERAAGG